MRARFCRFGVVILTFCALACGCAKLDQTADLDLLVAHDAVNAQTIRLRDDVWQLTYSSQRRYPETALSGEQFAGLASRGWSRCTSSREDWENYEDATSSTGDLSCVFQQVRYFARDGDLITLSFEYKLPIEGLCPAVPDGDIQTVIAVLYRDKGEKILSERGCSQ